tara:strand:+ start:21371 stop:22051 length:681 start_codon:yes stop_codon:yes gene_type:complete
MRNICVIGASRGIGKYLVNHLESQGNNVISLARNKNECKNIINCDLNDFISIEKAVEEVKNKYKTIYALINVAGIASMNLALATPAEVSRNIINTNLLGTIFSNQLFAPLIIRHGGGRIINFSTIAVKLGIKGESIYTASKAGVESYTRSLAKELSSFNITVNCIAPGPIDTDLIKGVSENQIKKIVDQQIFQKQMTPFDVADQVDLILSEKSRYLSGQVFVLGGY